MRMVKKAVTELEEYVVAQDTALVKLNQNESPYDMPAELKKEILTRLAKIKWDRYPSSKPISLIKAISSYVKYPDAGIVTGNGSNEIIQTVLLAVCEPEDKVVVVSPGYSIYPRLAKIMGLTIVDVPLLENFRFDVASIIKKSKGARLVILASPNNPTGTALSIDEVRNIAGNIDGLLVVDEAYFEFYKRTAVGLLKKIRNLMIIRTFSKALGIAGLRLGYLIARPEVAREINKAKLPFSVGIFQQSAGEVIAQNPKYIRNVVDEVIKERNKLFHALGEIGSVKPIPSSANFILFEVEGMPAKHVFESLYKRGVLLRYFGTQRLKNMLRVTVGRPQENTIFLQNLKTVLEA